MKMKKLLNADWAKEMLRADEAKAVGSMGTPREPTCTPWAAIVASGQDQNSVLLAF